MFASTPRAAILERLRALGPPEPRVADEAGTVDPWRHELPTTEALRERRCSIFGREAELPPPIDWRQDPHGSRSWRYQLHTLTWLRPAIEQHALAGDPDGLAAARDVALDWCDQHVGVGADDSEVSEFAWYDMAVGLRGPYLAYVLRAELHAGRLADDDARLLLTAIERHADALADASTYAAGHNHGLYQDEGLYLIARQLPALPLAREWAELAIARMLKTLSETVSLAEGAHLEHSTAYQFAIVNLVARVASVADDVPELGELLDRMRRTAAWQVTPLGRLVQLGDTDDLPAPRWARDTAASLEGLHALFDAGQAFVRDGDGYLAASAAYHGRAHKQADDSGFVLIERGRVLLGDAGRWGYYEDEPDRVYARSGHAHNLLTVDDREVDWTRARPHGGALEAVGTGDGWYAIAMSNRLLDDLGVAHRRVLLYRPRVALIAIDDVRADALHDYVRHFHFGPGIEVEQRDGALEVVGPRTAATLVVGAAEGELASLERGRDEPTRRGWTYPRDRKRKPIWSAAFATRASDATLVAALWLDGSRTTVVATRVGDSALAIDLGGSESLTVELDGRRANVLERAGLSRA